MFSHQRDNFVIAEILLAEAKFAIDRLARSQNVSRCEAHLLEQAAQLRLAQWLEVVVNFLKVDAALPEQSVQLATLASSRLFVDDDFVRHIME